LAIIVLTLNKFLWLKFEVFTGSPIHPPPSRCSQKQTKKGIKEKSLEVFTFSHSRLLKLFSEGY
jgi:hypothetical protein